MNSLNRPLHILFIFLIFGNISIQLIDCLAGASNAGDYDGTESDTDIINSFIESKNETSIEPPPISNNSNFTTKVNLNETSSKCQCVKYYDCEIVDQSHVGLGGNSTNTNTPSFPLLGSSNKTDIDEGSDLLGIVDIRQNISPCPHYFDVCCVLLNNTTMTTTTTTTTELPPGYGETPKPTPTSEPDLDKDDKAKKLAEIMKNITSNWSHKKCGHRNEQGVGFKITGGSGSESEFGEFPWTAAIFLAEPSEEVKDQVRNVFLCGGSLLHPKVILTAAHCVFHWANSASSNQLKVRMGEWDTQTMDEPFPHQDRHVKEIIIHEQIYRKGLYNDVALLILDKEVKLAPNVDTICLPSNTDSSQFDGQNCFSSGWGKDAFGTEGRFQEIMKKVEIPIVPRKACESQLRKTKLSDQFRLHESFICAGGFANKSDTCQGDGGSPLVCKPLNSESYVQMGIVAWGIGCGPNLPAAYVNVPLLSPWIQSKMKARNLDSIYCTQ